MGGVASLVEGGDLLDSDLVKVDRNVMQYVLGARNLRECCWYSLCLLDKKGQHAVGRICHSMHSEMEMDQDR